MKYTRKKKWRECICKVLLFCLVLAIFPSKEYSALAANFISPEDSYGKIWNNGFLLSEYTFSGEGLLTLTNTYHYEPGPIMTYYTVDTIWSKYKSNATGFGYPKRTGIEGRDWVKTGVSARDLPSRGSYSYSNYYYTQDNIRSMLTTLYGELKPETPYKVYMSELFILKQRHTNGSATYYRDTVYDNIDAIREAVAWTTTTRNQFAAYYDIPMTFVLHGGTLNIICVDMDNGNAEIEGTRQVKKMVLGDTYTVEPTLQLTVDGDTLSYAGKYNIGWMPTLAKTGYPEPYTMVDKQNINIYLGYKRGIPPVTKPPTTPVPTNTPTPTPTNTPIPTNTPTPAPGISGTPAPSGTPSPSDFHMEIRKSGQKVQIYADDYNASTDSLTDLQPYLTDDIAGSPGGIPSTEQVAIRAKAPGWEYDVNL